MHKLLISTLLVLCAIAGVNAQNTTMSPYSRYGYGRLNDNATASQRQMGYVGYAMNSGRQINVMNPASYAAMDSLTFLFDMGIDFTAKWSKEGSLSEKDYGGGLDYITMQVPIIRGLGASVGLLPFSSVGYSFGNEIKNGSVARDGAGSFNQLYLGIGGSPFKGFAIGANIAYLFGNTTNTLYAYPNNATSSVFERRMSVSDWRLDIGMQYSFFVTPANRVTLGLTYSPKKNLHGETYGIYYENSSSGSIVPDTVNIGDTRLAGRYSIPETWGAGINWNYRNRIMVEADFTYQPWSKAKYAAIENFEDTKFANRWRAGLGIQYTPSLRGSYLSRINYRVGGYYNRDYVMIRDNNLRDYAVTMGFGFPVPGFKTIVNLGLEYHHRQAHPNPLIKEQFLNLTLGINFNEMWFRKNRLY